MVWSFSLLISLISKLSFFTLVFSRSVPNTNKIPDLIQQKNYINPMSYKNFSEFENLVMKNKIVIFGADYCFFTQKALSLARTIDNSTVFVDRKDEPELFEELKSKFAQTTVPFVFYEHRFIEGGCSGFEKMIQEQKGSRTL